MTLAKCLGHVSMCIHEVSVPYMHDEAASTATRCATVLASKIWMSKELPPSALLVFVGDVDAACGSAAAAGAASSLAGGSDEDEGDASFGTTS